MGYSTRFKGTFDLVGENMTEGIAEFINGLANTRRMKRDVTKLSKIADRENNAEFGFELKSPLYGFGKEGEFYFPKKTTNSGQTHTEDIGELDYNTPPSTQPSLWLDWVVGYNEATPRDFWLRSKDGNSYHYVEWLEYLMTRIFNPLNIKLHGLVEWQGEEEGDYGVIEAIGNRLEIHEETYIDDIIKQREIEKKVRKENEIENYIEKFAKHFTADEVVTAAQFIHLLFKSSRIVELKPFSTSLMFEGLDIDNNLYETLKTIAKKYK